MNRVGEYIKFAVCFSGLGYLVLWPLSTYDALHLSPGLHLTGMASSACVLIGLVSRPLRRRYRGRTKTMPEAVARLRLGKKRAPPPPRRYVRPRSHFGLRGAPH